MLSPDAQNNSFQHHSGGTSRVNSACGVVGGTIVFNDCGGFIKSAGGAGISIFGTKRVNGFAQPARSKKEITTRYFIVYSKTYSVLNQYIFRLQINSS